MKDIERQLYLCGAHVVFKDVRPEDNQPLPLRKWKVPLAPGVKKRMMAKQRVIAGIPRDPVDKTAAIVTSPRPKT